MGRAGSKRRSFEISKRLVFEAWMRVRANRGAPGVDRQSVTGFESDEGNLLYKLWSRMSAGSYMPAPVRAVEIPKDHGAGVRVLGVPTTADRVAQTAVAAWLEERLEPVFHPDSYGYRPGRSAHDALAVTRRRCWQQDWVLDLDIRSFLEPSSHCQRVHGDGVEQGVFGLWDQYSQAFAASVADVEGVELAALDTLQHGLAGDAEAPHRVDDRDVASGGVLDEQGAELVVDADPPRAPGVSCSPRMNPACSQRNSVDAATPSSSAALPTGSSSPSGGSAGGLYAGILR